MKVEYVIYFPVENFRDIFNFRLGQYKHIAEHLTNEDSIKRLLILNLKSISRERGIGITAVAKNRTS